MQQPNERASVVSALELRQQLGIELAEESRPHRLDSRHERVSIVRNPRPLRQWIASVRPPWPSESRRFQIGI